MNGKEQLFSISRTQEAITAGPVQFSLYTVILITKGNGLYYADHGRFPFSAPAMLFSTPFQQIFIEQTEPVELATIQFHGDFYCIEYHRAEVSCNGLLFNNCYIEPVITIATTDCLLFKHLLDDLEKEFQQAVPNETVLAAYLQLWLAKASAIKMNALQNPSLKKPDLLMERFRELVDLHYRKLHKPGDYASLLHISANTLTKHSSQYFNKTPSRLINERLIQEAKKLLHLTRQSIKEIAFNLEFEDEFYFSRVFKKFTKLSPQQFRKQTGISVVASLSENTGENNS